MLEVAQLTRYYGSFKAVDNVSFTIEHGQVVGLLGHNGAGKTTIMKMISGFLEPNQGSITVDGIDLQQTPKLAQRQIGYLPENLPIYPEMGVADYLDYIGDLKGLAGQHKTDEIRRVIQQTDLADKLIAPIATLSRGYKQRVGVAQAILGNPKLLILDEPTNGLDPTQTQLMRTLIRDLSNHATVILSTHIMQEVDAICDRVLMIRSGELVVDASLTELQNSNRLNISTSMTADNFTAMAKAITAVETVEAVSDHNATAHQYTVKVQDDTAGEGTDNHSIQRVSGEIAKQIIESGADLFSIDQQRHNLETLFREVNSGSTPAPIATSQQKEAKDAA